ncbi:MAG: RNA polymerase sigma factor RpoD/SigA [Chthoniobacteraceae bacterium]
MKRISTVQNGDWTALDAYLRDVSSMPLLSEEEAVALGARASGGDVSAQEQLVKANLRLVVRIAHQYAGFGLPLADMISEGNIGLIRAAELYNPKFGTKFATYASVWIKQRIHRAITSQARAVRIPVWRSQRLRKLTRLNDELSAQLGRTATDEDLGDRLGLSADQIAALQGDRLHLVSLDEPVSEENETPLHETFRDENAVDPLERLGEQELVSEIMACLHDLDDRELEILSLKHGFHPTGEVSFRKLARKLGVSHEWVRRIAELAVVKVRRALAQSRSLPARELERRRERVLRRMRAFGAAPA